MRIKLVVTTELERQIERGWPDLKYEPFGLHLFPIFMVKHKHISLWSPICLF